MTLELADVQNFKITEFAKSNAVEVEISGLAFHSSLAVSRTETVKTGSDMQVKIELVPARYGLSGSFTNVFLVPPEINRVVFGDQKKVIWQRSSSNR